MNTPDTPPLDWKPNDADPLDDARAALEAIEHATPAHVALRPMPPVSSLPRVLVTSDETLDPEVRNELVQLSKPPPTKASRRRSRSQHRANDKGFRSVPDSMMSRGSLITVATTNRKMRRAR